MNKSLQDALDVRFSSDAGDDLSIRQYFEQLLITLWEEGERFSGKRPFGNSGWEYDLYQPLILGGFIKGTLDTDGNVVDVNEQKAFVYVRNLIRELCTA